MKFGGYGKIEMAPQDSARVLTEAAQVAGQTLCERVADVTLDVAVENGNLAQNSNDVAIRAFPEPGAPMRSFAGEVTDRTHTVWTAASISYEQPPIIPEGGSPSTLTQYTSETRFARTEGTIGDLVQVTDSQQVPHMDRGPDDRAAPNLPMLGPIRPATLDSIVNLARDVAASARLLPEPLRSPDEMRVWGSATSSSRTT
jgi:hypothetical protein